MKARCWSRLIGAAVVVALAAGCEAPADRVSLRFVGFKEGSGAVSYLSTPLRDGNTATVDAGFENATFLVGGGDKSSGVGILVHRVRVTYALTGYAPPAYEYPVTLYLPAPASGETTPGTISGLPLVPVFLKEWVIAHVSPLGKEIPLTARVVFYAETDEGHELEVQTGIAVVLANP